MPTNEMCLQSDQVFAVQCGGTVIHSIVCAGVKNIVCAAPPNRSTGRVHPNTLYAMRAAGATHILALGGVQVLQSVSRYLPKF